MMLSEWINDGGKIPYGVKITARRSSSVPSYPRCAVLAAAVVLAVCLVLSLVSFGSVLQESPVEFALGFVLVASGPLGGWITAAHSGSIPEALWSLFPLTALTFGPLLMAAYRPASRRICFGVSVSAWIVAGYYYGFAMSI
jgi:hypothetical protein